MIPSYAYITGDAIFLAVWFVLFFARDDLRKEMIHMSLIFSFLGPLSEFYYRRDYWHPTLLGGIPIGLEDWLFAFAIGGISVVIYEEVFGKRIAAHRVKPQRNWRFGVIISAIIWMFVGVEVFKFNSIYVSIAGFLAAGCCIVFVRHDLLTDALWSGILTSVLMFFFYTLFIYLFPGVIQSWWSLGNISGILVRGIPLEELGWGFAWGFFAGPVYEFTRGLKFKSD